MPRSAPHTVAAIEAISEGQRALNVLFLSDGVVDESEMRVIRLLREAQARMHRADWSRRARQSVENMGDLNPRLIREFRELDDEFPLESA